MKKTAISLLLVLALVLCVVLVTAPTTHAEEFSHTSSSGHEGWTDLTTLADKTNLDGNYYLSGDITDLAAKITIKNGATVTVCLNGNNISATSQVFYLDNSDVLHLCDCCGTGEISTTTTSSGCVVYAKDTSTFNLYGGILNGSNSTGGAAGTIRVNSSGTTFNMYGGTVQNGQAKTVGGNVYMAGKMYMYGGTIQGGTAGERGGNINATTDNLYLYGGKILGGSDSLGASIWVNNDKKLNGDNASLAPIDALVAEGKLELSGAIYRGRGANKSLYKMYSDMGTAQNPVSFDIGKVAKAQVTIDLNGNDLNVTLKNANKANYTYNVYVIDSTTDDFVCGENDYGILTYSFASTEEKIDLMNVEKEIGDATSAAGGKRYIAIPEGNGYSFHRIYVGIENISLEKKDDGSIGMGYTTAFKADAKVKAALAAGSEVFGITIGMNDDKGTADDASDDDFIAGNDLPKSFGKAASAFVAGGTANQVTLRVNNILSSEGVTGVAADIRAQTYVKLNFGGEDVTVTSNAYVYSLQDVVDALYAVENLETQNAAAAGLLAFIKSEYNIEATPAPAA